MKFKKKVYITNLKLTSKFSLSGSLCSLWIKKKKPILNGLEIQKNPEKYETLNDKPL